MIFSKLEKKPNSKIQIFKSLSDEIDTKVNIESYYLKKSFTDERSLDAAKSEFIKNHASKYHKEVFLKLDIDSPDNDINSVFELVKEEVICFQSDLFGFGDIFNMSQDKIREISIKLIKKYEHLTYPFLDYKFVVHRENLP